MPRTLILEPTRELAAQVEDSFDKYGKNHKLNVALIIGGVSFDDQDSKLMRGVDVLIATPGRLLDHSERGRLLDVRRRTPRHRRSRPHARHGLHPGHRAHLQARAVHAPDAVLHRHHAAGDPAHHRAVPAQSGEGRGGEARHHRRRDPAATGEDRARAARQARHAAPHHPRGGQFQERHHLLQSQARGRAAAPLAGAPRLQRRGAARRPGSVGAHRRAGCVSAAAKPSC